MATAATAASSLWTALATALSKLGGGAKGGAEGGAQKKEIAPPAVLGVGVLIFAKHPALHSIAAVAVIGGAY